MLLFSKPIPVQLIMPWICEVNVLIWLQFFQELGSPACIFFNQGWTQMIQSFKEFSAFHKHLPAVHYSVQKIIFTKRSLKMTHKG